MGLAQTRVSGVGSPGEQTSACSSCPAQEQHLPRLLHGQDLQGQSGPLRSSLGGTVGDTLALGASMLLPVEPKPPPVLYLVCQVPMASRALPGLEVGSPEVCQ